MKQLIERQFAFWRIATCYGLLMVVGTSTGQAGPYAPAAGLPGSTAISKDDARFVGWATQVSLTRGAMNLSDPGLGVASFGPEENALGPAAAESSDVVSLGDGGQITLGFARPISDGPGFDFAVFENSFSDTFLELAVVEVSSNGVDFVRFDAVSLTSTQQQVGSFGQLDPSNLNNLAGKYRQGFGTPFDLSELAGAPTLDVSEIRFVRVIDVVGAVDLLYATQDSLGSAINDPWPTPFESSGFDLDAVGVVYFSTPELGDMNGDGAINADDASAFVLALTDRSRYDRAYPGLDADLLGDLNASGVFNLGDVADFKRLLNLPGILARGDTDATGSVPEPGGFALLTIACLSFLLSGKRANVRSRIFRNTV